MDGEPPADLASTGNLPNISVHVKGLDGAFMKIRICKGSTISKLKEAISANRGTSCLELKLVHKTTVMHNSDLIGNFSDDDASPLEVTMILSALGGVLDSCEALDLIKRVDAVPTSIVQEMLATLASHAGVSELPAHFAEWFEILLESGIVLTFWDPRECLNHPKRHSLGSLCLSWTGEDLGAIGVTADEYCMLDVADGDGTVSMFSAFDATYESCAEWKQQGKFEQSWGSLSEYVMFKVDKQSERIKNSTEHERLTKFGRCVKIQCLLPSASGDGFEYKVLTLEFTPDFEAYTVSALKSRLTDMTGVVPDKLRVIFAGREIEDSRHLAEEYGFHGGCTFHVVGKK